MALSKDDIAKVKAWGFLRNRGTELFSGRVVPEGSVFTAEQLAVIAECAKKYGSGKVAFTSRLAAEVIGIPFDKIEEARAFVKENAGIEFGGTGAKIRPVTACKGTTCVYGNFDTQALAKKIHNEYYIGWSDVKLPHKFKIGVGGCPNSCMKPSLNDFGVEGHRVPEYDEDKCRACTVCQIDVSCPSKAVSRGEDGKPVIDKEACKTCGVCSGKCPFKAFNPDTEVQYQLYVGGTWGKTTRMGTKLSRLVKEEEILPIMEKTMLWFKDNAYQKERLGKAIDRIGVDKLEEALFGDELMARKEEILSAEMKQA